MEEFVTSINEAGLPINRATHPAKGNETIKDLTKEDVMQLYWRMKGIEIAFKYTVDGQTHDRYYTFNIKRTPKQRIAASPYIFLKKETDEAPYGVKFKMGMDLSKIRFTGKENPVYHILFSFYEHNTGPNFYIGLTKPTGWTTLNTKNITFMKRKLTLILSAKHSNMTGKIHSVNVSLRFIE